MYLNIFSLFSPKVPTGLTRGGLQFLLVKATHTSDILDNSEKISDKQNASFSSP